MKAKDKKWVVFWCSLLHSVIFNGIEPNQAHRFFKKLSDHEVLLPNGKKKKPSLSALKRKLKKSRRIGSRGREPPRRTGSRGAAPTQRTGPGERQPNQ